MPASEVAVGIVHHLLTLHRCRRGSCRSSTSATGSPTDCPTFVVMPSMLVRPESAAQPARAAGDPLTSPTPTRMLRFALLTDFADAPEEHRPEDEGYVRPRSTGVRR